MCFFLSDRALTVGDPCKISNHLGVVEDITLRSVRLRTLDQTLVSVPAGMLAQAGIENFARTPPRFSGSGRRASDARRKVRRSGRARLADF
jgi:small-conductance mechanosensitive channel